VIWRRDADPGKCCRILTPKWIFLIVGNPPAASGGMSEIRSDVSVRMRGWPYIQAAGQVFCRYGEATDGQMGGRSWG
jgi:hypothetical protein